MNTAEQTLKIPGYKVSFPTEKDVLIETERSKAYFPAIFLIVFMSIWYFGLYQMTEQSGNIFNDFYQLIIQDPFILIFLLVPLAFIIPVWLQTVKKLVVSDIWNFSGSRGIIYKNGTYFASVHEVESFLHNNGSGQLQMQLKSGTSVSLLSTRNSQDFNDLINTLSAITGIAIKQTIEPNKR